MNTNKLVAVRSVSLAKIAKLLRSGKVDFVVRSGFGGKTSIWVRDEKKAHQMSLSRQFIEIKSQIDGFGQFNTMPGNMAFRETMDLLAKHFDTVVDGGEPENFL